MAVRNARRADAEFRDMPCMSRIYGTSHSYNLHRKLTGILTNVAAVLCLKVYAIELLQ